MILVFLPAGYSQFGDDCHGRLSYLSWEEIDAAVQLLLHVFDFHVLVVYAKLKTMLPNNL